MNILKLLGRFISKLGMVGNIFQLGVLSLFGNVINGMVKTMQANTVSWGLTLLGR